MDTNGNYEYLKSLVAAAKADGLNDLAAEYQNMADVLYAQIRAEARIDRAAQASANARIQIMKDILDDFNVGSQLYKKERFNRAMRKSNLYLAIRNAIYFE